VHSQETDAPGENQSLLEIGTASRWSAPELRGQSVSNQTSMKESQNQ
jgi:hypothetical protein